MGKVRHDSGGELVLRINNEALDEILDETINDFVPENEKVINIEAKTENGSTRFWIYMINEEGRR